VVVRGLGQMARQTRRGVLVEVVLVAVAVVGGAVWLVVGGGYGYGERAAGPFGAYPAPVPARGPREPPRVIGRFWGPVALAGGLVIVADNDRVPPIANEVPPSDGVVAVSLRTGREYWSYRRRGHIILSFMAGAKGVYVLWEDGLMARVDQRTVDESPPGVQDPLRRRLPD
jgi:hypothetical protein